MGNNTVSAFVPVAEYIENQEPLTDFQPVSEFNATFTPVAEYQEPEPELQGPPAPLETEQPIEPVKPQLPGMGQTLVDISAARRQANKTILDGIRSFTRKGSRVSEVPESVKNINSGNWPLVNDPVQAGMIRTDITRPTTPAPQVNIDVTQPAKAPGLQNELDVQNVPEQWNQPEKVEPFDQGKALAEMGEGIVSAASGAASWIPAGLYAAASISPPGMLLRQSPAEVVDTARKIQGALTYQPKTEGGQAIAGAAAYPFTKTAEMGQESRDIWWQEAEKARQSGDSVKAAGLDALGFIAGIGGESWPFLVGPAFKGAMERIRAEKPWIDMSVEERGIVIQTLANTIKKNPNMTEAEILRKWNNPTFREEALTRRQNKPAEPVTKGIKKQESAQEKAARQAKSDTIENRIFILETEDFGKVEVQFIKKKDGSSAIITDKGIITNNAEFTAMKTPEELIKYYAEPQGFLSVKEIETVKSQPGSTIPPEPIEEAAPFTPVAEAKAEPAQAAIEKPVSTPVEIPDFKSTGEAVAFSKVATPEQLEQVKALRAQYEADWAKAMEAKDLQEAINVGTKAQLMREVIEAKAAPERFDIKAKKTTPAPEVAAPAEKLVSSKGITAERRQAFLDRKAAREAEAAKAGPLKQYRYSMKLAGQMQTLKIEARSAEDAVKRISKEIGMPNYYVKAKAVIWEASPDEIDTGILPRSETQPEPVKAGAPTLDQKRAEFNARKEEQKKEITIKQRPPRTVETAKGIVGVVQQMGGIKSEEARKYVPSVYRKNGRTTDVILTELPEKWKIYIQTEEQLYNALVKRLENPEITEDLNEAAIRKAEEEYYRAAQEAENDGIETREIEQATREGEELADAEIKKSVADDDFFEKAREELIRQQEEEAANKPFSLSGEEEVIPREKMTPQQKIAADKKAGLVKTLPHQKKKFVYPSTEIPAATTGTQKDMFADKGQTNLLDIEKELSKEIDEKTEPPEGGFLGAGGPPKKGGGFSFEDPEIEKRFKAAEGVTKEKILDQARAVIDAVWRKISRDKFELLPQNEEFARLRFDLLKLEKQKGVATDKTLRNIQGINIGLDKQSYDLFRRKVVIDDLLESAKEDMDLPFGFTKESLKAEAARLERVITGNDAIASAIDKRNRLWTGLKEAYIEAMDDIGFNVADRFKRKNYYRHQVLDKVRSEGLFGTGKKLKTPTSRGFLKERKGSELDINSDFIQAEHEVMAQMYYDIEVAKTIKVVDEKYNISRSLKEKGKAKNYENIVGGPANVRRLKELRREALELKDIRPKDSDIKARLKEISEEIWDLDPTMPYRAKMAQGFSGLNKDLGIEDIEFDEGDLVGGISFNEVVTLANEGNVNASMILKAISDREAFMRETLGRDYLQWKQSIDPRLIPEGYEPWQPREGNIFYMVDTIPAKLAEQLQAGLVESLGITAEDLGKALAQGGKRKEFIIKSEVAGTLNELQKQKSENPILKGHKELVKAWKVWQLVSPRRWFKYNARNVTGDLDAVIAGDVKILKHVPQAVNDLYAVFGQGRGMSADLKAWFERGGQGSNLQAQEMGEFNDLKIFKKVLDQRKGVTELPAQAWKGYWKAARLSTDFRESILRYSAYLRAMEIMKASRDGLPKEYWASIPEEIKGLDNMQDRAFWLSNSLLGAYDRISVAGQVLRESLYPFWSWKETNFKRYARMFRNAASDRRLASQIGKKAAGAAVKTPYVAYRIGRFLIKASAFWAAIQAWNWLMFPDEEDDLPESIRSKPHIVLGRDENGKVEYFSRLGAVSDLLENFGVDAAPHYIDQWFKGRMSLKDISIEMAKSPANILVQGAEPFSKTVAELLSRRAFFPDAFNPRVVRDRTLYVMQQFGLENEWKAVAGLPSRPYGESLKNLFAYSVDPLEAAYSEAYELKRDYLKRQGKISEGFFLTPKGSAMYNAKLALRYDDSWAFKKYLKEYAALYLNGGGDISKIDDAIEKSLTAMDPLYGMSKADQSGFVMQLNAEEKETIVKAYKFYNDLLTLTPDKTEAKK